MNAKGYGHNGECIALLSPKQEPFPLFPPQIAATTARDTKGTGFPPPRKEDILALFVLKVANLRAIFVKGKVY